MRPTGPLLIPALRGALPKRERFPAVFSPRHIPRLRLQGRGSPPGLPRGPFINCAIGFIRLVLINRGCFIKLKE